MNQPLRVVTLSDYDSVAPAAMLERATLFNRLMQRRRSVRMFSDRPVASSVIEQCLAAGASAPSGANLQPWHFIAVSNPQTKRESAERRRKKSACSAALRRRADFGSPRPHHSIARSVPPAESLE
jgi:nitroreductase